MSEKPITVDDLNRNYEDREPKFTAMQLRFIDAYMADPNRNAQKAAEDAGAGSGSANRWLDQPHIQKEIAYRENARLRKNVVTVEMLTSWVTQVVRRCMQKQSVKAPDGRIVKYKFDAGNALKGCELLYKVFGVIGGSSKLENAKAADREPTLSVADIVPLLRAAQKMMSEDAKPKQMVLVDSIPDAIDGLVNEVDPHENRPISVPPGEEIPLDRWAGIRNVSDYMKQVSERVVD